MCKESKHMFVIRRKEIKKYAETAMLGIMSSDWIMTSMIASKEKAIKEGDLDVGTLADSVANLSHLFALALYKQLNKGKE